MHSLRLRRGKDAVLVEEDGRVAIPTTRTFEGVTPNLERRYRETDSEQVREELEKYMNVMPCPACQGSAG